MERSIAGKIPRLTEQERQIWLLDQRINNRGICLDQSLVKASLAVVEQSRASANEKIQRITCGSVNTITNAPTLTEWINERGFSCDGVSKDSVSKLLEEDLPEDVAAALKLRAENALSSTAKLRAMSDACCPDGRLRGLLKYHGASTGRWSGKLVSLRTFPRHAFRHRSGNQDRDAGKRITGRYPPRATVEVISSLLRAMFHAPEGKALVAQIIHQSKHECWLGSQVKTSFDYFCIR